MVFFSSLRAPINHLSTTLVSYLLVCFCTSMYKFISYVSDYICMYVHVHRYMYLYDIYLQIIRSIYCTVHTNTYDIISRIVRIYIYTCIQVCTYFILLLLHIRKSRSALKGRTWSNNNRARVGETEYLKKLKKKKKEK